MGQAAAAVTAESALDHLNHGGELGGQDWVVYEDEAFPFLPLRCFLGSAVPL